MRLKRRLDFRIIFLGLYFVSFFAYLVYGLLPADASTYAIDSHLIIPSIALSSGVTKVEIVDGNLPTPETIVGSYSNFDNKTFLFGHSSTVFTNLNKVKVGDIVLYNNSVYEVASYEVTKKSDIDMSVLLGQSSRSSLVLMTCAGEDYGGGDYSHRLIITAVLR